MSHILQVVAWIAFALLGATCDANSPQAKEETSVAEKSGTISALILPEQLKQILDSEPGSVRIIEASTDLKKYQQGHIPNAIYVHWLEDMIHPEQQELYSNPTSEQLATLMSRNGISNEDRIIIYDRFASRLSTRLCWTLKFHGHQNVQVLNGGFQAWTAQYKLSKKAPNYPATKYRVSSSRPELLAEIDFVKEHLNDPNTRFIDGRPKKQYSGEEPGKVYHTGKAHSKRGHIPKAAHVFWKDNFNPDGTFKSVPELKKLYENAGIRPDQSVVTYCNEGLHAAAPWFVLTELLGYKDVRLYDNSMAEWANSDNPVEIEPNDGK